MDAYAERLRCTDDEVADRSKDWASYLTEVRGAAFDDIDNNGDLDILVTNANGPVRLLLNQVGNQKALAFCAPGRHRLQPRWDGCAGSAAATGQTRAMA